MKWRNALIIFLAILAGFLAYNYFKQPFLKYFPEPTIEQPAELAEEKKQDLSFAELTTKEKISQMLMLPLLLANDLDPEENEDLALIKKYNPGFIIYFGEEIDYETAKKYQESLLDKVGEKQILPLLAVDHEGGQVQRFSGEGFTALPSMRQLADSVNFSEDEQNADLLNARERSALLNQSAKELSELGINLVLAPVVDFSATTNPILTDRIANDPDKIVQIAQEYIRAFSNWQIMPVLKHFPGIGSSRKDLHLYADTVDLDKNDTLIFERLLDQYPNIGVMSAHLRLKDKLAGQACSLSKQCLDQLFQFYPKTLVITDDLLMESAAYIPGSNEKKTLSTIVIEAIQAGNHVLLFGVGFDYAQLNSLLKDLESRYEESLDFQKLVDQASAKILSLKGFSN
ncbi:MAG: glycoside hydrolase family 3 protein [Candidatus Pacebacteria bacterium]|jgi:beta-N-acetylhexosaminidase|nr:glycoside hydrolase family 3 protein [Candidatus Paceibacterota bacterium]